MFQNELRIGVGIDTGRYRHRASFTRPDLEVAAKPLTFKESPEGYATLRQAMNRLQEKYESCQIHVHVDAAGQYATNLEYFLRSMKDVTVSVGEPKRNKDYHAVVSPKIKTDDTESAAMARYAVAERPKGTQGLSPEFIALQELTRRLKIKVGDQTRSINRLHNLLCRVFPELATFVSDIAATWVLRLLDKYPTPARISRAHVLTLAQIPHASQEKVAKVQELAANSIGSFQGPYAEALMRLTVEELQQAIVHRKSLETLVEQAFEALPVAGHSQLATIPGIGLATAAVLTSKIIDIERFATPEKLVGYFGTFPKLRKSGVDKYGNPKPSQTNRMCQQGNDLVRGYLYSAAKTAIRCNPAVRAFYKRLRSKGTRGDVALGHCMRKLVHLAFAVWSSNKPFNPEHYPWDAPVKDQIDGDEEKKNGVSAMVEAVEAAEPENGETKNAAGRNQAREQDSQAVTAANDIEDPPQQPVNPKPPGRPYLDFTFVRSQISIQQMLEHLGLLDTLRPSNRELRGPCPIHSKETDRRRRHFAVNPEKNVFQCFSCNAKGNHLDFWAKLHDLTTYEATLNLVETFKLEPSRLEERSP